MVVALAMRACASGMEVATDGKEESVCEPLSDEPEGASKIVQPRPTSCPSFVAILPSKLMLPCKTEGVVARVASPGDLPELCGPERMMTASAETLIGKAN